MRKQEVDSLRGPLILNSKDRTLDLGNWYIKRNLCTYSLIWTWFWDADACNLHLEMKKVLNHENCVMLMTFFPILVILTGMCYIYFILFFVLIVGFSWNYLCWNVMAFVFSRIFACNNYYRFLNVLSFNGYEQVKQIKKPVVIKIGRAHVWTPVTA